MGKKKKKSQPGWHGGRTKANGAKTYEGDQYRGGRQKGRKNLKKNKSGEWVNQFGVTFTPEERKKLENEVNKANRKRNKYIEEAGQLPRKVGGKETGDKVRSLQLMGREQEFVLSRRSKSLQRFKSRGDYEDYMKSLKKINSPHYLDERTREYKRNHITALENAFGDDAKDVMMKIRMMKPAEYRKLIEQDEDMSISYIYDPSEKNARLNRIRASLGMNLKEDDFSDEELPY